jgi:hypothetical protein
MEQDSLFLMELEERKLTYVGGLAKNRKVTVENPGDTQKEIRLDGLAESVLNSDFTPIQLKLKKRELYG